MLATLLLAGCGGTVIDSTQTVTVPPPAARHVTSAQVAAAFARAGLPVVDPHPITAQEWGLAPRLTSDATRFLIPSLGPDTGGRVFVLPSPTALAQLKAYYDGLSQRSAALASWVLVNPAARVLVDIPYSLPKPMADRYQAALARL